MTIIVSVEEAKRMMENEAVRWIDVRQKEANFSDGEEAYFDHHIENAIYLHIKRDLTGKDTFLPEPESLAKKLSEKGITETTPVIIYDSENYRTATKTWVALHYIGHERAYILNGGLQAWQDAGGKLTDKIEQFAPKTYRTNVRTKLLAQINDVEESLTDEATVLIDSRAHQRYTGEVEPKYKKAGHIPGAVNYEAKRVLTEDGNWHDTTDLQKYFAKLKNYDDIIVSCGSGNSACLNVVALKEAGFSDVRLYAGGFSEWIADDDREVETVTRE